jgi:F420H(2)-dependent quinone reductase
VPLCSLRDGDSVVVIATYGVLARSPSWWLKLEHEPQATVRLGPDQPRRHGARHALSGERERLWQR